jgi:hypothetical protein
MAIKKEMTKKIMKKAQFESWIANFIFYLALLIVSIVIVWALLSGKLPALWSEFIDKVRIA